MISLRGIFPPPSKEAKKNFIKENVRNLRNIQNNRHNETSNNKITNCTKTEKSMTTMNELLPENKQLKKEKSSINLNRSSSSGKNTLEPYVKQELTKIRKADMSEYLRRRKFRETTNYETGLSKVTCNAAAAERLNDPKNRPDIISNFRDVGCQYSEPDTTHFFTDGTKIRVMYPSKFVTDSLDKKKQMEMGDVKRDKPPKAAPRLKKEGHACTSKVVPSRYMSNLNISNATDAGTDRSKVSSMSPLKLDPNIPVSQEDKNPMLPPPNYQKGVVPKYIKDLKQKSQQKRDLDEYEVDSMCPPGHIALPESERIETLKILKEKFAVMVSELNHMPVRTDTLRMRNRKMQLDKELSKLEEGIKVFSRPKVYVNIEV